MREEDRHQGPCQCAVDLPLGYRVIELYYHALPRVVTPPFSSSQIAHGESMPAWSPVTLGALGVTASLFQGWQRGFHSPMSTLYVGHCFSGVATCSPHFTLPECSS